MKKHRDVAIKTKMGVTDELLGIHPGNFRECPWTCADLWVEMYRFLGKSVLHSFTDACMFEGHQL